MAGRPVLRKMRQDIERAGGIGYICTLIADGYTMKRIGQRFGVSRQLIYHYINEDEERRRRFDEARAASADTLIDDTLEDLEAPLPPGAGSAEVALRNSRANFKKWLAGIRNDLYSPKTGEGVNVNVNLGTQHLDALMKRGVSKLEAEEIPPPEEGQTGTTPPLPPQRQTGTNDVIEELL